MAADRRALARGCLLAVTLFAACVDGPTSPGSFGELRLRPSYPAADAPSALGLSVDSARVRVVRPGDASSPLVDARVAYNSDTASLGWLIELSADEESMQVDIEIWDDGTRVYEGSDVTLVRDGSVAAALIAPVMMAYVGPTIADTVILTPDALEFDALNDTAGLAGEVRDRNGVLVATAITWTSDDETVATVDATTGLVAAVGNGETTVRGAAGAATGSVSVSVSQRVAAVTITPNGAALTALGATQQFTAIAEDRLGSEVSDATVAWTSSDPAVASVDAATGMVTAVAGGSATITATSGDVGATATVSVNPVADVTSVTVSPVTSTLTNIGATQQFTAVARDAGGTVLAGVQFTWTSSAPSVAGVEVSTGLAMAVAHGETTISAAAGGVTGTATLRVDLTQSVARITVTPESATLTALGATQQFTATARDAMGAVIPGITFGWASALPSVASIDPGSGLAIAAGHGETTISASTGGVTASVILAVDLTQTVVRIAVEPAEATVSTVGATQQFTATAFDAADAVVPGITFAWTSSAPGVAGIEVSAGLATAVAHGEATISASTNGITGTASLSVDLAQTVAWITVSPETAALSAVDSTQQFTATAFDAADAVVPGIAFAWTSSAPAVATIDPSTGVATASGHGQTTIAATTNGITAASTLTVDLASQTAIVVVAPIKPTLGAIGETQQFTAEVRDASGTVLPGVPVTWSSTDAGVATIDAGTGLATAVSNGVTTVTATADGVSGTTILTVRQQVSRVEVSPETATIDGVGATQQFTARAYDANDHLIADATFTWASLNEGVATVSDGGLATAVATGIATIKAHLNGRYGAAILTVR